MSSSSSLSLASSLYGGEYAHPVEKVLPASLHGEETQAMMMSDSNKSSNMTQTQQQMQYQASENSQSQQQLSESTLFSILDQIKSNLIGTFISYEKGRYCDNSVGTQPVSDDQENGYHLVINHNLNKDLQSHICDNKWWNQLPWTTGCNPQQTQSESDKLCLPSYNSTLASSDTVQAPSHTKIFTYGSLMSPESAATDNIVVTTDSQSGSGSSVRPVLSLGMTRKYDYFRNEDHVKKVYEKWGLLSLNKDSEQYQQPGQDDNLNNSNDSSILKSIKDGQVAMLDIEPSLSYESNQQSSQYINGGVFELNPAHYQDMMKREQGYDLSPTVVIDWIKLRQEIQKEMTNLMSQQSLTESGSESELNSHDGNNTASKDSSETDNSKIVDNLVEQIKHSLLTGQDSNTDTVNNSKSTDDSHPLAQIAYTFSLPQNHPFKRAGLGAMPQYHDKVYTAVGEAGQMICDENGDANSDSNSKLSNSNCSKEVENALFKKIFDKTTMVSQQLDSANMKVNDDSDHETHQDGINTKISESDTIKEPESHKLIPKPNEISDTSDSSKLETAVTNGNLNQNDVIDKNLTHTNSHNDSDSDSHTTTATNFPIWKSLEELYNNKLHEAEEAKTAVAEIHAVNSGLSGNFL